MKQPDVCILRQHKTRLKAFYYDMGNIVQRGNKLAIRYSFYSVEELKNVNRRDMTAMYRKISPELIAVPIDQIRMVEKRKVLVYGRITRDRKEEVDTYLARHGLEMELSPFEEKVGEEDSYQELQKVFFFAQRLRKPPL